MYWGKNKKGKNFFRLYLYLCVFSTFSLCTVVVWLAEQLFILHQVELITGVEFATAQHAHEAVHVVDIVLRPPNHRARRDSLSTARTFGAELAEEILPAVDLAVLDEAFLAQRLGAGGASETLGVPRLVHHLNTKIHISKGEKPVWKSICDKHICIEIKLVRSRPGKPISQPDTVKPLSNPLSEMKVVLLIACNFSDPLGLGLLCELANFV